MRRGPGSLYRKLRSLEYLATRDRRAALAFLRNECVRVPTTERLKLLTRYVQITNAVRGYHTLTEMLVVAREILARDRPVVLEAGCGYGASTAKLSLAVALARGSLVACDSFRGIPDNDERHVLMDGRGTEFRSGAFRGTLASVARTVARWGEPSVCRFEKGWFHETLPHLDSGFDVVVLDVDLIGSTRTCLRALWPKLRHDGVVFSLDGQLRATHQLMGDVGFWRDEIGVEPPRIEGLDEEKLIAIYASPKRLTRIEI